MMLATGMTVENRLLESDNTPAYLSVFLFVQLHSRTNFDHEVAFEHAHTLLHPERSILSRLLSVRWR